MNKGVFFFVFVVLLFAWQPIIGQEKYDDANSDFMKETVLLKIEKDTVVIKFYKRAALYVEFFLGMIKNGVRDKCTIESVIPRMTMRFLFSKEEMTKPSKGLAIKPYHANLRGTLFLTPDKDKKDYVSNPFSFFLNVGNNFFYNGKTIVFAKVIYGMEILDKITKYPRRTNNELQKKLKIEFYKK